MKDAFSITDQERELLEAIDQGSKSWKGIDYEQFFKTFSDPETNKLLLDLKKRGLIECLDSAPLGMDSEKCYPIKAIAKGKTALKRGRPGWNINNQ